MILAGDVGGTKTVLGLFETDAARLTPVASASYPSAEAPSLEAMVELFLREHSVAGLRAASFGVPGPVLGDRIELVNLPWAIEARALAKACGLDRVDLCNDLVATGEGIPELESDEFFTLQEGQPSASGSAALLAPGTGLGMTLLARLDGRLHPLPSEGGHIDFAPRDAAEIELLNGLSQRFGRVSVERILCGPGLLNVYEHLKNTGFAPELPQIQERLRTHDAGAVIGPAALSGECALCVRTLELFCSILGATAGNLALIGLTTAGVFLGGGIPPKILPALAGGRFLAAFHAKGRFRMLMQSLPVRVILNEKTALLGAARRAARRVS